MLLIPKSAIINTVRAFRHTKQPFVRGLLNSKQVISETKVLKSMDVQKIYKVILDDRSSCRSDSASLASAFTIIRFSNIKKMRAGKNVATMKK